MATLLIILAAVLYVDFFGLPALFHTGLRQRLRTSGINADFTAIQIGIFNGIRIHNPVVYDGLSPKAPVMGRADAVQLRFRVTDLLTGRLAPRSLALSMAEIKIPVEPVPCHDREPPTPETVNLTLTDFELLLNPGQWFIPVAHGHCLGISFRGSTVIDNLSYLTPSEAEYISWNRFPRLQEESFQSGLRQARKLYHDHLRGQGTEAEAAFSLQIDLEKPEELVLDGSFSFSDLTYRDLFWPKVEGQFNFADGLWQGQNLVIAAAGNVIRGNLQFTVATQELVFHLHGRTQPATVYQLIKKPMPEFLAHTGFLIPPHFDLEFRGSTRDPAESRFTARVKARSILHNSLLFEELELHLNYCPQRIEIAELTLSPAPAAGQKQWLRGQGVYSRTANRASGRIEGRLAPATAIAVLPAAGPAAAWLPELNFSSRPIQFRLRLEDSHLDPASWQGNGEISLADFKFRNVEIKKITLDTQFSHGVIETRNPIEVTLAAPGENLSLELSVDLTDRQVSGRGQGALDFTRLYRELQLPSVKPLQRLHFHGPPPRFDLELHPSPLLDISAWHLSGKLEGEQIEYDSLPIDRIQGTAAMANGRARFENVTVHSPHFTDVRLDYLDTSLTGQDLLLAGSLTGDPKAIKAFIKRGDPRRNYVRVWEDFAWLGQLPDFRVEHLHYQKEPDGQTRWKVAMNATVEAENITYRDVPVDHASARVVLNLPEELSVKELKLKLDDSRKQHLEGRVDLVLHHDPYWRFIGRGQLDPGRIIRAIGPDTEAHLSHLRFHPETDLTMEGTVRMRGGPGIRISSRFNGPEINFYGLRGRDYRLAWELAGHDLRWHLEEAELYGGAMRGSGLFNTFTGAGKASIALQDVKTSDLVAVFSQNGTTTDLGRLTTSANLDWQQITSSGAINLTGGGKLKIEDAKFWEFPLVKNLGDVAGLGSLGRITALEADLEFLGNRVKASSLQTDGTVLSLEGQGTYCWSQRQIDLLVRGRTLRATAFLGTILRPLSWLFEARLQGSAEEAKWSTIPLGGIMSGSREPK